MSQESSPAVVEFGPASGPPDTPVAHRPMLSRLLSGAHLDDRVVPALAGLGGVAFFVSLMSPWQASVVDGSEFGSTGQQTVNRGLMDLGSWGPAYLLGAFAVAACAALVVFGQPPVRQHARLAGLGVGGALFATVVALAVELSRDSLVYPNFYVGPEPDPTLRSGLYLALVGVAAVGAALYLAGRLPPPAGVDEDEATPAGLWRWRRTRRSEPEPAEPPPPADLTVMPARPFIHGPQR